MPDLCWYVVLPAILVFLWYLHARWLYNAIGVLYAIVQEQDSETRRLRDLIAAQNKLMQAVPREEGWMP